MSNLVVETLYGLDKPANVEGRWNLHRHDAWRAVMERLSLTPVRADGLLASGRAKLLTARAKRPRPGRDEKILTGWNALAISGLARAAQVLEREDWLDLAQRTADRLREALFVDGVLHATWQDGRARLPAYLDDHAYLLDAMLALLEACWRDADLDFACQLADCLLAHFEDADRGGFYFTRHDHEALLYRPKPTQDDATPPGNAVAARALHTLGHLMGREAYLQSADRTLVWARQAMAQQPAGHCAMLSALQVCRDGGEQIIVRGPVGELGPWLAAARAGYQPARRVFGIPYEGVGRLPDYLAETSASTHTGVVAYRCAGSSCSAPIRSLDDLQAALDRA